MDSTTTSKSLLPMLISSSLSPVPAKLVKKIQDGLFVKTAELLTDTLISLQYTADDQVTGHKQKPKEVTDIMCFGTFMATISLKECHKIPDFIGYQNFIIQSSINSQEGCWVTHDRWFHLKASVTTIPEWSSIDTTMWKMAFPECQPTGGSFIYVPFKPLLYRPLQQPFNGTSSISSSRIYLKWNENPNSECSCPSCRFDHLCYRCVHGQQRAPDCTTKYYGYHFFCHD